MIRMNEAERQAHLKARRETIARAIEFLETSDEYDALMVLQQTQIHAHLKTDPAALVDKLRQEESAAGLSGFGCWKASQQICQAAGLPY